LENRGNPCESATGVRSPEIFRGEGDLQKTLEGLFKGRIPTQNKPGGHKNENPRVSLKKRLLEKKKKVYKKRQGER